MPEPLDTCREWIETALTGLNKVIYAHQSPADAPRPALPYASIWIHSDQPLHSQPLEVTTNVAQGDNVILVRSEARRGTLRVDLFGSDSQKWARTLQLSRRTEAIRSLFHDAIRADGEPLDLVVRPVGPIVNTTRLLDPTWEPSAQVEFFISWVAAETENVPWINQVDISGTYEFTVTAPP